MFELIRLDRLAAGGSGGREPSLSGQRAECWPSEGERGPLSAPRGERGMLRQERGVRVRDDRFGPVSGGRCFFSFESSPDRIGDLESAHVLCNIKKNKGADMRVVKTLILLVTTAHYCRNKHAAGALVAFRNTKPDVTLQ